MSAATITVVHPATNTQRTVKTNNNGLYDVPALPPGNYKVELNAQKVISTRKQKGFDGKDEEVQITDELFPERYNAKSTLTAKVEPGTNKLKFDATAK